jgi:hypothetical protein
MCLYFIVPKVFQPLSVPVVCYKHTAYSEQPSAYYTYGLEILRWPIQFCTFRREGRLTKRRAEKPIQQSIMDCNKRHKRTKEVLSKSAGSWRQKFILELSGFESAAHWISVGNCQAFDSHTSFKIKFLHVLVVTPHIYQLNAHIYLYNNIFTTFFLHVSICYTLSSGRDTRISA